MQTDYSTTFIDRAQFQAAMADPSARFLAFGQLAHNVATKRIFQIPGIEMDDLVSIATLHCVRKFNRWDGHRCAFNYFSSVCANSIRSHIRNHRRVSTRQRSIHLLRI